MYYGATKASSQCHAGNILLWRNGRAGVGARHHYGRGILEVPGAAIGLDT